MRRASQQDEILHVANEIMRLQVRLNELLISNHDDDASSEEQSADLLGTRVRITHGPHKSKCGVVTGKRGSQFWWILLDDDTRIYKMAHNFTPISN